MGFRNHTLSALSPGSPVALPGLPSGREAHLTLPMPSRAPEGPVLATLVAERGEGFSWEAMFGGVEATLGSPLLRSVDAGSR